MNKVIKDTLLVVGGVVAASVIGVGIGIVGAKLLGRSEDQRAIKELDELIEPTFYAIVKSEELNEFQKELRIAGEVLRLKSRAAFIFDNEERERIQAKIDEFASSAKDMLAAA